MKCICKQDYVQNSYQIFLSGNTHEYDIEAMFHMNNKKREEYIINLIKLRNIAHNKNE